MATTGDRDTRSHDGDADREHQPQQPRGSWSLDRTGLARSVEMPAGGAEADEAVRLQGEDAAEQQEQEWQVEVGQRPPDPPDVAVGQRGAGAGPDAVPERHVAEHQLRSGRALPALRPGLADSAGHRADDPRLLRPEARSRRIQTPCATDRQRHCAGLIRRCARVRGCAPWVVSRSRRASFHRQGRGNPGTRSCCERR